ATRASDIARRSRQGSTWPPRWPHSEYRPSPGSGGKLKDHAAYIQSWLKVLRNDKRAIFAAAAHAQRAADFLHGLQPVIEDDKEVAA
ncbi:zincin-like metallopeptidase domain-containing protein, partial [Mangrovicoccus sp. HB161399]|uniref:zincin-like metallopeptidase domain-containing protein n=1 Tax=Mangrovicoccus sp. HB161399 TaxID=2720392 RepID=UPI0020A684F7